MSGRKVLNKVQRSTKDFATLFRSLSPGPRGLGPTRHHEYRAQPPSSAGSRENSLSGPLSATEGEVFFNQTSAQCDRGYGRGGAHSVVRQARQNTEPFGKFG